MPQGKKVFRLASGRHPVSARKAAVAVEQLTQRLVRVHRASASFLWWRRRHDAGNGRAERGSTNHERAARRSYPIVHRYNPMQANQPAGNGEKLHACRLGTPAVFGIRSSPFRAHFSFRRNTIWPERGLFAQTDRRWPNTAAIRGLYAFTADLRHHSELSKKG